MINLPDKGMCYCPSPAFQGNLCKAGMDTCKALYSTFDGTSSSIHCVLLGVIFLMDTLSFGFCICSV